MTLQAAVRDVRDSIQILQQVPVNQRAGLLLDEVTVTFNVAASANAKNSGQVNITANPALTITAGATGSIELTNDANRGNVIVMKFKNLATADYSKGSFVTPGTGDYPGATRKTGSGGGGKPEMFRNRRPKRPPSDAGTQKSQPPRIGQQEPAPAPTPPADAQKPPTNDGPGSTGGGGRGTLQIPPIYE